MFETGVWRPIGFASRYLTPYEQKYSTNELELLGVVWGIEYFRNYLYGRQFTIITDHQAIPSILRDNRGNKTYLTRMNRWIEKILPLHKSAP